MRKYTVLTISCILIGSFLLTPAYAAKEPIRFTDSQWQSLWINNAIAMFIVEHGYGYPVESLVLSTPVARQSLTRGDADVMMEIWRVNDTEWYNRVIESGEMLDIGQIFEKSAQGWYVPTYVIKGDPERGIEAMAPDLKSVFDLPKYKELFEDPESPGKGRIYSCITGWVCAGVNQVKIRAYELTEDFNLFEPGTKPALDSAIVRAYERGKPVVSYYWEPTALVGSYDLTMLEEPEYTQECWDQVDTIVSGGMDMEDTPKEAGCSYEITDIHKGINPSLKDRAPEVVEFLEKMFIGTDRLNKIAAYMEKEGLEADEAAVWFFNTYADVWHEWVPDDVAAKVEEAL